MHIPSPIDFLKIAGNTASHFGFEHLDIVKDDPACKNCGKKIEHKASAAERKIDALHGMLTEGAISYFDNKLNGIEGPVFFYTTNAVPRTGETAFSLHVLNVDKSIAEVLLIQTIRTLLENLNFPDHSVRINSLGDQDSVTRHGRELTNFFRKRMEDLPPPAREAMKEHVFSALMHLVEKDHELATKGPSTLEYLSDPSRKHFREIVEYLDMSGTPYEIDPRLIGHPHCYSEALFAIDIRNEESDILAEQPLHIRGGRYNSFVSRMTKSPVASAGAVIVLKDKKLPATMPKNRKRATPSVFMVQLGFSPKMRSLMLVNELQKAGIPVSQDIVSDSLGTQLRKAENAGAQYAIIVGQKEFVDKTVILRDLKAQSQEHVPISQIVPHLKRLLG